MIGMHIRQYKATENLCRCGTYTRIKRAIRQAAEKVRNA